MNMEMISLALMSGLYLAAGITHFVKPRPYLSIMPPWVPAPAFVVALTGAMELTFAVLLWPELTRRVTCWLIMVFLVAVFPANVQMTINFARKKKKGLWLTVLRLPLQAVLIWWAWGLS